MKNLLILLLGFFLTSCNIMQSEELKSKEDIKEKIIDTMIEENPKLKENENKDDKDLLSSENGIIENTKNIKYSYKYDNEAMYKKDNSLFINKMLVAYPSKINSKKSSPYSLEDLKNLDYGKDIRFSLQNFKIPNKAEIFSNDLGEYIIDFPKSDEYNISIKFKNLFKEDKNKEKADSIDIIDLTNKEIEKNKKLTVKQKALAIYSNYKNAAYAIAEDDSYRHTYLLVESPVNVIFFDFIEEKEKSNLSSYIMADILSTMYIDSEDPMFVVKDFRNWKDKLNLYATERIKLDGISIQIPNNMKIIQENESLKVFIDQHEDNVVSEVIFTTFDKGDDSLEGGFDKISGSNIPPAYIIPIGQTKTEDIKNLKTISSKARLYTESYTLEGYKTTIETKDKFISLLVLGPLENNNEIGLLNKNILDTLDLSQ